MLNSFNNNQVKNSVSTDLKQKTLKSAPPLSLNLHTMPKTSNHHLKQWLLLGLLIGGSFLLIAYFLF